ncbi:MAG: hypothetical protein P8X91_04400 [Candidatus Bathyarchaeota archaeon]
MKKKIGGTFSSCKLKSVFTLTFILMMVLTTTVLAVEYNCGLSEGHYIKYGNYAVTPATEIELDWTKKQSTST